MDLFGIPIELVAAGGPAIISVFKAFKFVKEGEEGIKLRFGKAVRRADGEPKVHPAGFAVLIPFADTLVTRHVRVQTLELKQQSITIKNGLSYIVDAVLRFRVVKIYNALFVVDDLDTVMRNVSMSTLRKVLTPATDAAEMTRTEELSTRLTTSLKEHEGEWGVEVEEFSIISCVPTPESQQIVIAEAGAAIRLKGLVSAFKNTTGLEMVLKHSQLAATLIGIPVAVSVGQPAQVTTRRIPAKVEGKKTVFSAELEAK